MTGQVQYTASVSYTGPDSFTFKANDGALDSNLGTVHVTVTDNAPIAVNDSAVTVPGKPVFIPVLNNDSDPDNDPLQLVSVTQPANGVAWITSGNLVVYQANAGFYGIDSFGYVISDGALTATATVYVTVGQPQLAAAAAPLDNPVALLTGGELQPVFTRARQDVALALGVSSASPLFGPINVQITSLQSGILGVTYGNTIWIDAAAAGYGWYTDTGSAFAASGKMDLLTVLGHELGHVVGLASIDPSLRPHDLMTTTLEPGVRRLQEPAFGQSPLPLDLGSLFRPDSPLAGRTGNPSHAQEGGILSRHETIDLTFSALPMSGSRPHVSDDWLSEWFLPNPSPAATRDEVWAEDGEL
jgi:hypothetical protein